MRPLAPIFLALTLTLAGCNEAPDKRLADAWTDATLDLISPDGPRSDAPTNDRGLDLGAPDISTADTTADTTAPAKAHKGVNLAGAEFAPQHVPGTYGTHYIYPTQAEVTYFMGKGMNTFRLPFLWERLQPTASGPLVAKELARLDAFVTFATGKGAYVILDPHNYARYHGKIIGNGAPKAAFADLWSRLASHFKANPRVIFGLMNEPHGMVTETWVDDANAAIAAIRAAKATHLILVPGNAWSGAHSWSATYYGTANAVAMLKIVDPGKNIAFEVHQYLDGDSSGTSSTCSSVNAGVDRLKGFTAWLRKHKQRGFLGEFAGANNSVCDQALDKMLAYITTNNDVWIGWTWWAAGPWWGSYFFSIEPQGGKDAPQLAVLAKHL